jgi:hypothetical protein
LYLHVWRTCLTSEWWDGDCSNTADILASREHEEEAAVAMGSDPSFDHVLDRSVEAEAADPETAIGLPHFHS